jgi:3-hydroxyacyl-CoA dehydrogenase/enoyl-CoA hydratase/3-hydroxybutyryl-CoA epimerase
MAYKTTHGNLPHIKKCTEAIYYGAACHIDKALEIEARYFVDTLFSKERNQNIIRASFIFINDARGKSNPKAMTEFLQKSRRYRCWNDGAGLLM